MKQRASSPRASVDLSSRQPSPPHSSFSESCVGLGVWLNRKVRQTWAPASRNSQNPRRRRHGAITIWFSTYDNKSTHRFRRNRGQCDERKGGDVWARCVWYGQEFASQNMRTFHSRGRQQPEDKHRGFQRAIVLSSGNCRDIWHLLY